VGTIALRALGVGALLSIGVLFAAIKTYYSASGSMEPTLDLNDVLLVYRFAYWFGAPRDGQIVILTAPLPAQNVFLKRVIAGPGESVRIHRGVVYRDGVVLSEPYVKEPTEYEFEIKNYQILVDGTPLDPELANIPPRRDWTSPNTVPPKCYIVLGDNRNNSEDGHVFGFAQSGGTFLGGVRAGQTLNPMEHAIAILSPSDRVGSLP
jgi:signal peptidase I